METLRPMASALTPSAIASAGAAYLERLTELSDGPAAITGYCMGGRIGWTIAATHPDRVRAIAGFHTGQMVTDSADSPHLLAPHVSAEVYWGHADNDPSMTPENIATLDRAMDDNGVHHTTEVHTGRPFRSGEDRRSGPRHHDDRARRWVGSGRATGHP
jgi:carboxymethylenebutenolidase